MSLPSLETLATLAAAMSSPAEEPEATAARALALWRASDIALRQAVFLDTQKRGHAIAHLDAIAEFDVFLSKCLGREMTSDVPAAGEMAELTAVLAALLPTKDTAERIGIWRGFRMSDLTFQDEKQGLPPKKPEELESAVADLIRRDRRDGLPAHLLHDVRHCFVRFFERLSREKLSERGKKGGRPKKSI